MKTTFLAALLVMGFSGVARASVDACLDDAAPGIESVNRMPLASVATVCHDWTEEDGELTCLDEDELFYTGHYGFAEMGGELFAIVEY